MDEDEMPHTRCMDCGASFDDSFQLIDHALDEDEEFDPYYLLPNGYKFMLGSFLRMMFTNAEDSEHIKMITQCTYTTLFAAENGYDFVDELVEEMIVKSALHNFDDGLKDLLEKDTNTDEGGG